MKKLLSLLLALALVFFLAACGSKTDDTTTDDTQGDANAESVDLVVFAAASMTETLTQIAELYKEVAPNVNITYNFDSSGKLLTQISEELGQIHLAILKIDNALPRFRARRREILKLSKSTDSFGSKIHQSCPPNPAPLGCETASQTFPRKGDAASVKRQSR